MQQKWQSIETAPKDGTRIIVFWPKYAYNATGERPSPFIDVGWYKINGRIARASAEERAGLLPAYFANTDELDDYGLACPGHGASHWMPLPDSPKDGD
jgi:hypothetical protein